jgi:hypothetical protein
MCQPGHFPYLVFVKEVRAFPSDGHALPEQLIVLAREAIEFGRIHKINPSARGAYQRWNRKITIS